MLITSNTVLPVFYYRTAGKMPPTTSQEVRQVCPDAILPQSQKRTGKVCLCVFWNPHSLGARKRWAVEGDEKEAVLTKAVTAVTFRICYFLKMHLQWSEGWETSFGEYEEPNQHRVSLKIFYSNMIYISRKAHNEFLCQLIKLITNNLTIPTSPLLFLTCESVITRYDSVKQYLWLHTKRPDIHNAFK